MKVPRGTIIEKEMTRDVLREKKSAYRKYLDLAVGQVGFFRFLLYELVVTLFTNIPGALGYFLRKIFFPLILGKTGKGVVFGRGMTLRHPWKIEIGNNVVFDDYVTLDAKTAEGRITIGDNCIFAKNVTLSCKGGPIKIGNYVNISVNTTIYSNTGVEIGDYTFIAGHCYIVAGGNHEIEDTTKPILFQPILSKGGVKIGEDCWIGAGSVILDGVTLEKGVVVGAHSLVNKSFPAYSIIVGSPAKLLRKRGEKKDIS